MSDQATYYEDLIRKAAELAGSTDWQTAFDEFDLIKTKWADGPEADADVKAAGYQAILESQRQFSERRKAHWEQVNERRNVNMARREDLVRRLQEIVDNKRWSQAAEVAALQRRFEDIRPLPADVDEQNKRFEALVAVFNDHKVEYYVKQRQKEDENLLMKLAILEKMKGMVDSLDESVSDWTATDAELESLSDQWRRVGKVAKEKADEVWDQYKSVREAYQSAKLAFDKTFRAELEKNKAARVHLCDKAEELLKVEDLAYAAKEMNVLHKRWKELGPTFRDESEALWQRFKTASDQFNQVKHQNLDAIRESEQQNYEAKEALCVKAEALSSDGASHGHDAVETLFREWNAIGPVPRRKNRKIWTRFKTAIDAYQLQRRKQFKDARLEQRENLNRKRDVIERINALAANPPADGLADQLKQLQTEFQGIGFVPIKQKEAVWQDYRAASDAAYALVRNSGERPRPTPARMERAPTPGDARTDLMRLKKECDELHATILHYADAQTYIKPNKTGNVLRDEIQAKIDAAKAQLEQKLAELQHLRKQMS
jgi:hypothetical protein